MKNNMKILARKYLDFLKIIENSPEDVDNLKIMLNMFFDIDEKTYNKMPYQRVLQKADIVNMIVNKTHILPIIIEMEGVKYGINPDFSDITMGEMLDLETDDVLKQMAILYRPIVKQKNKKYIIEEYNGNYNLDLFNNNITLEQMLGFIGFFLKINEDYLSYIQSSLEKEQVLNQEMKKSLQKNGVGGLGSID